MQRSEILDGLLAREERALSELYDQFSKPLLGIIFRILGDRNVAEEVLQQTMLKAWNNIQQFDQTKGTLFTWLCTIARNSALDKGRLKSFQATQKTESIDTTVYTNRSVQTDANSIDVQKLLSKLDNKYKEVLDLVYLNGYSQSEAAEKLDIPIGTVKTRVRHAISLLSDELKNEKGLFIGFLLIVALLIIYS
jgi:RNA polymerase sigma-70 factor (ECF subfamily)